MATKKFTRKAKTTAPTLFDATEESTAIVKKLSAERETAIKELQEIIDKVADMRMNFVQESLIEGGLITAEDLKTNEVIKGLIKLWRENISNIEVTPGDNYYRLKARIIELFGIKEFEYWMYNDYRYLQQVTWFILKSKEFCKLYKVNRRKALKLMDKCGWDFIMRNFNPKDGWELETDRQAEKFRNEHPELFLKPDTGRAYAGLLDHSKTEFDYMIGGEEAIIYKALAMFSKRELTRSEVHKHLSEIYETADDINWVINTYIDEWQHDLAGYVTFLLADDEEEVVEEPIEKKTKKDKTVKEEVMQKSKSEKVKNETIKVMEKIQATGKTSRSKKVYSIFDVTTKTKAFADAPTEFFKGRKLAKFIRTADHAYEFEAGDEFMITFLVEENFTKASAERLVEEMVNLTSRQYKKFLENFQTRLSLVRGKVQFK